MTDCAPAPPPVAARPVASCPLSDTDFLCIRHAARVWHAVRRSARVARASAITTLIIAAIGSPVVLIWPSGVGILMLVGVWLVGVCEYLGYRRLRRADPAAAGWLARNQLFLLVLIVGYCVLRLATHAYRPADTESWTSQLDQLDPAVARQLADLIPTLFVVLYGTVIVLSILVQGGMAVYYFTRKRQLLNWQHTTPAWVQRLFRELQD